jgi:hypothetical protein
MVLHIQHEGTGKAWALGRSRPGPSTAVSWARPCPAAQRRPKRAVAPTAGQAVASLRALMCRIAVWAACLPQERARVIKETTPMVLSRPLKLCNFLVRPCAPPRRLWRCNSLLGPCAGCAGSWGAAQTAGSCGTAVYNGLVPGGVACLLRGGPGPVPRVSRVSPHTNPHHTPPCVALQDWKNTKLIYKRYASLYFVCGVDPADNELITLEIIHE